MDGELLSDQIYDWLAHHYPDGPEWNRTDFHCFRECHPIIQAVVAIDTVEGEISNGAWGQLLWNTLPNWRYVLDRATDGYALMEAVEQAAAVPLLSAKLAEFESQCLDAMRRAEAGDFNYEFGAFTAIGYSDSKFAPQLLFMEGEDMLSRRYNWFASNRAAVLHALAA